LFVVSICIYTIIGALFVTVSYRYPTTYPCILPYLLLEECQPLSNWGMAFGVYASLLALIKGFLVSYVYNKERMQADNSTFQLEEIVLRYLLL
jgi:hypothetical protein